MVLRVEMVERVVESRQNVAFGLSLGIKGVDESPEEAATRGLSLDLPLPLPLFLGVSGSFFYCHFGGML